MSAPYDDLVALVAVLGATRMLVRNRRMRISRRDSDPELLQGRFDRGRILVMLYRGDYWQIGFVIPKGGIEEVHRRGLKAFRTEVADGPANTSGSVVRISSSTNCDLPAKAALSWALFSVHSAMLNLLCR